MPPINTTYSISIETLVGLGTLVTTTLAALTAAVVSIITAVKQNRTQRAIDRVEVHANSMSERLQAVAYDKGAAEEKVKQAAAVITEVAKATNGPKAPAS